MPVLGDLLQDLRYGLRGLRRRPGVTALIVLSLGLGLGTNVAIFSIVDAVMWRRLPVVEPERLVLLGDGTVSGKMDGLVSGTLHLYSHPLFRLLRAESPSFSGLAAQASGGVKVTLRAAGEGEPAGEVLEDARAEARLVSGNFFSVLGVKALRGRTLGPEDEEPGAGTAVVLSHSFWQRRFGGDPRLIGTRVSLDGRAHTVVGVTGPGFIGIEPGDATDLWVPLAGQPALERSPSLLDDPGQWWLLPVGRLQPGASAGAAAAHLNLVLQRFLDQHPELTRDAQARRTVRIELTPGAMGVAALQRYLREPLLMLSAAGGLLLLIVCFNVSQLLLARALERQREIGIRTALGAGRGRLVRQLLAEGISLAALGGMLGGLASRWLSDGLLALGEIRGLEVPLDGRTWGFVTAVSLLTLLLHGLVPALRGSRGDIQQALRATASAVTARVAGRATRILLTLQVALSAVLLVAAGLMATSLTKLRRVDKGFDDQHLLLVGFQARLAAPDGDPDRQLAGRLLERVTALPGVRSASLSFTEILGGGRVTENVTVPGNDPRGSGLHRVRLVRVTADYFETVGMALARGRGFAPADLAGAARVAVINETLARQAFGGAQEALGRRLQFDPRSSPAQPTGPIQVVGVVRNARISDLRREPPAVLYLSAAQTPGSLGSLQVRTAGDPAQLAGAVRAALIQAHPELVVTSVRTMRAQVDRWLIQQRMLVTLAAAFAGAALLLVSLGLFGVISQWAAQRTREIGVRQALGASAAQVRWLVLRQSLALTLIGALLGLPAAVAAASTIDHFLYGVRPLDATTLAAATVLLVAVAAAAAYLPARRASRVPPMIALRWE